MPRINGINVSQDEYDERAREVLAQAAFAFAGAAGTVARLAKLSDEALASVKQFGAEIEAYEERQRSRRYSI